MTDHPLFLGVDVGTTAAKAALFAPDGHLVGFGQTEYPTTYLSPGRVEQQPEDWWNATCAAIQGALAAVPQADQRVVGVAVSAQAPTLIALDRSGKPVRPAMIWMDRRAEAESAYFDQKLGKGATYKITGNRPDPFYVAAKILWLKNHEPDHFAQTAQFVQITGFINYRLTGQWTLDNAHAALLGLRDSKADDWSAELCGICGVEPSHFPPIFPGHQVQGEVTREAAEATGLRPGTPVMVGTVDGAAAAVEAGAVEAGTAAEMTGTSTVLIMPTPRGKFNPAFIAMPHAIPGLHLLLGAMVASGASLRWFRDQLGALEVQQAGEAGRDAFDLLTEQAAQVSVGSDGVLFLPYMMGERAPLWHTQARGVFFGLSLSTTKGAMIRAILEGTAFALRHNVEVARESGAALKEIRSVGGGTRSALWNQIKADVTGLPVMLPKTSVGAPFGDAVLVGIGLGYYPDPAAALREIVQIKTEYTPDPERHRRYNALYSLYRSIYDHLRTDFDWLANVMRGSGQNRADAADA